jgi:rSAM/selenodomain-associated transferase 2
MSAPAPLVSVIVPVLNEAAVLPATLDHVAGLEGLFEVLVADGGSRDASVGAALCHPLRPWVVTSERGRACQMNEGARQAAGDVLLFLHADSRLPDDAYAQIAAALADAEVAGGNFALRFDGGDRFSGLLGRVYALQRRIGIYYGDSSIWLRREAFERLGGFRPLPVMEDYDLVRRLERSAKTRCLPGPAITSARRWQRLGLARTVASWVVIRWLFIAGASPRRLASLYPHVR